MKSKTKRRSRFLRCFGGRGATLEVEPDDASSSASVRMKTVDLDSSAEERRRRKSACRRLLLKIVRSAVFVKFLEKGRGSGRQDETDGSSSHKSCAFSPSDTWQEGSLSGSPSTTTTSSCSSSASTAANSPSARPAGTPATQRGRKVRRGRLNLPMSLALLLVLSLAVMLLWGRMCAVVWTSTCLCLAPRGGPRPPARHGHGVELEEEAMAVQGLGIRYLNGSGG